MAETYSIAEVSEQFGLAPSTLRFYDREGMLPGLIRTAGGVRRFTQETVAALHVIECLKSSGLSISDIKRFFELTRAGDSTIAERLELFRNRREAVETQIKSLQRTLDLLNFKCWYYETAQNMGTEDALLQMSDSDIPPALLDARRQIECLPSGTDSQWEQE